MVPSSPVVRQVIAAQWAEDRRGEARSSSRRTRRPHAVRHPLAALRARRAAAAAPAAATGVC
jgi:hypothetical protein